METLKRLRLLARRDDWMVSFDLADGFYHVGIHEADRKYFQVAIAGQLYEFAALPMGWSLSPAIFCASSLQRGAAGTSSLRTSMVSFEASQDGLQNLLLCEYQTKSMVNWWLVSRTSCLR